MNRISIVIKERVNTILDNYQDPREVLDHSYVKQTEMLNKLR
jgi:phage shock protein A